MPTMAAVALDRLLHQQDDAGHHPPSELPLLPPPLPPPPQQQPDHYYISPALYATPEPTPIPSSSSSLISLSPSTSPYVFNRKGSRPPPPVSSAAGEESFPSNGHSAVAGGDEVNEEEAEEEVDGFLGPRDARSECSAGFTPRQITPNCEFFDAAADFFSDSSVSQSPWTSRHSHLELHALRLNLLEETARRNMSEESLLLMKNQLQSVMRSIAQLHVSMPVNHHFGDAQFEADPAELCQEIVVLSFVSEGIERTLAHVEAETAAEEVIDVKNNEISRLRDRLQYYETVNHEMSLRNQEVMEMSRQQRMNRKRRQRWIWRGVGLAVTLGASWLAYSCLSNSTDKPSNASSSSRSAESRV